MYACFAAFISESFFQGLVGNTVATIVAVMLGHTGAFYLQHLISSRGRKRQRGQLRVAMKQAVEHDFGTLQTTSTASVNWRVCGISPLTAKHCGIQAVAHRPDRRFFGELLMPRPSRNPKYRFHKARNLAAVTLDGKNHYLGRYKSAGSYRNASRADPIEALRYE